MLEMSWDSSVTGDALHLADAIELAVAFGGEDHDGRFTGADFQRLMVSESLASDGEGNLSSEEIDERVVYFEQALALVRNRREWLPAMYPFDVVAQEVRFVPEHGSRNHFYYLLLLMCSNGNHIPSLKGGLPLQFEDICKEAFRALFPQWASVLLFSQNSNDRKTVFGYSADRAIPKLAEMLNTKVINADQLPSTQREFGIDILAICSFGDQATYPYFAFGQCTVEREWWEKRHEACADYALADFLHINARHSNFLMIPHFPRFRLDEWSEDPSRTGNCILCDRFRLCKLLGEADRRRLERDSPRVARLFRVFEQESGVAN